MRTIIAGGLVVDATGREPVPGGVVAIEDGRIVAVGRAADFPEAVGTPVIDASGCTVMPGLIDGHVHVFSYPHRARFSDVEAAAWGTNYLLSALRGGVTTIRDLGSLYEAIFVLRKGVEAGWLVGPRVLVCGAALCMTGGHCWDAFSMEADGPDAVRQAARAQIKRQADVIKLMASGGASTPGETPRALQLTVEEMRAGVEEAHKAGLPTAAHAVPTASIKGALEAGVDCIEHGCFMDDETAERMVKGGTVYSPTVAVYRRLVDGARLGLVPEFMGRNATIVVEAHFEAVRRAVAAGVKIAMGTDAGARSHPLGDVAYELKLWVEAGMRPLAALEAATRVSAENCHVAHLVGTLEPGKRADVLIVEGDATTDIGAMDRVRRVLRDGATVYDAASGDATPGMVPAPVLGPRPGSA